MQTIRRLPRRLLSVKAGQRRQESTYQPPEPPKSATNPHRNFYKQFGRPIFKNFLIALCTYQAIYWSWLKLESLELKKEKDAEVHALEDELRSLTKNKPAS